ncbi:MAG TPA: hypothetical protein VIX81_06120 [Gammaproteobacteria bacterium]
MNKLLTTLACALALNTTAALAEAPSWEFATQEEVMADLHAVLDAAAQSAPQAATEAPSWEFASQAEVLADLKR